MAGERDYRIARQVARSINADRQLNYNARVWQSPDKGKTRVYISGGTGRTGHGFIDVEKGRVGQDSVKAPAGAGSLIDKAVDRGLARHNRVVERARRIGGSRVQRVLESVSSGISKLGGGAKSAASSRAGSD